MENTIEKHNANPFPQDEQRKNRRNLMAEMFLLPHYIKPLKE